MRKWLMFALLFGSLCGTIPAQAKEGIDWGEKIMFYLPNRILDALDLFSLNIGAGLKAEARLMATRLADVGAGVDFKSVKLYKDHNRRYGVGFEEGWFWSMIFVGEEDYSLLEASGLVEPYAEARAGVPSVVRRVYNVFDGPRDYWAIGGSLGFLIDANVYIHPVEWADFVLGFFFIDLKNDDLGVDDFR